MKNTLRYLLAACLSFTRLPLPNQHLHAQDFSKAIAFLPLVGAIVGLICLAIFNFALLYFSPLASIVIALAISTLVTGGLHEDGFADTVDGFLASHKTSEQRLHIMKDPHVGSFASLALTILFIMKLALVLDIQAEKQNLALLISFAAAKLPPLYMMHLLARLPQQQSKLSHHITVPPAITLSSLLLFAAMLLTTGVALTFAAIITLALSTYFCVWLSKRYLGAYNGDSLGFCEQLSFCALLGLWAAAF